MSGLSVRLPVKTPTANPASRNAPYLRYFFVASNPIAARIQTAPPFPSGDHEAYWSANNGTVALRGGITYDERNLAQGVQVEEITEAKDPYKTIYDPSNPEADEEGYVIVPNINVVEEMVNMVSASRAYEANAATAETTKGMISAALRI